MKAVKVILLHLPPSVQELAREAAQRAFGTPEIVEAASVDEISTVQPGENIPTLLLLDRDHSLVQAQALDPSSGLLPFTVVPLDAVAATAEGRASVSIIAELLRQALTVHELRSENQRLRGDLTTVVRRVFHDLRSPVGYIFTTADVLGELAADPESFASTADTIKASVSEFMQIVDHVGTTLTASLSPPLFSQVQMGPLVDDVLRQMEPRIKETNTTIVTPTTWPTVTGVSAWLNLVWKILIENTLDETSSKKTLRLDWHATTNQYRFNLRDNSTIAARSQNADPFVSFERLHGTRTKGLGLSIAQRLVTLQNGICGFEADGGTGGCWYFCLPA
ncbi:MAG: hypothetical protein QM790_07955 [Nibricoccus sp.]